MDSNRSVGPRPNVAAVASAPRPTPTPPRIHFAEVLGHTVLRGAEGALRTLPGGPMMAVAMRGGGGGGLPGAPPLAVPFGAPGMAPLGVAGVSPAARRAASPEGPLPAGAGAGGTAGAGEAGALESSLVQSQEMNLFYLRIQEEVNAQNRSFTALSNVLKAEHDTVKTAIGNIR